LNKVGLDRERLNRFETGRTKNHDSLVFRHGNSTENDLDVDKRQSPKSLDAVRADELLLIDFACTDLAFVKVRVKIAAMTFVDYLTWHRVEGTWLITSKGFRLETEENL
jgi:hypothetical protein